MEAGGLGGSVVSPRFVCLIESGADSQVRHGRMEPLSTRQRESVRRGASFSVSARDGVDDGERQIFVQGEWFWNIAIGSCKGSLSHN
eukprot:755107-Hanusia_phi.AAC.9